LAAQRKAVAGQQRSFMHQAMRIVAHAVNAALWNQLARSMPAPQNFLPPSARSVPQRNMSS
jgi:hypothetical protein